MKAVALLLCLLVLSAVRDGDSQGRTCKNRAREACSGSAGQTACTKHCNGTCANGHCYCYECYHRCKVPRESGPCTNLAQQQYCSSDCNGECANQKCYCDYCWDKP